MTSSVFRQIKDIQNQAGKLIVETPSTEDIESFSQFNEEMKLYLISHVDQPEIIQHVQSIPNVFDVEDEANGLPEFLMILLAIVTIGISHLYFQHLAHVRRINLIRDQIHVVKGKYATLEFLLKSME
ncbi:MAG: hypothetical protein HYZ44_18035 [Bacteroidetes bacterium]|nr:hypothetical protein [Bacteroidota bacterium]